jgi:hypothetical protein
MLARYPDDMVTRFAKTPIPAQKHGTYSGYAYYRCRCDRCREAKRVQQQRLRRESPTVKDPARVPADAHGSESTYSNYACRCAVCRAAHALAVAEMKARRSERPVPDRVHGTMNGYSNYGCRCDACRDVASRDRALRLGR